MRLRQRLKLISLLSMSSGLIVVILGAAPVPSSYSTVEKSVGRIRQTWSGASGDAQSQATQGGWNKLGDALLNDLRAYSKAPSNAARLDALKQIEEISSELGTLSWQPAIELREAVQQWLRPRLHVAEASRLVKDTLASLPPSADPAVQGNRSRWVDFVDKDFSDALRDYDSAETVAQRLAALRRIRQALHELKQLNLGHSWQPARELEAAYDDLFGQPNLDVTAGVAIVSPYFNANLVETGPIYRKGYWSQVTAGPKTGFGLLASDDGIAFYNKQTLVSVTPITDFQKQLEEDPQGQRAAKLYYFSATSYDWSELTVTTVLRPSGLTITPSQTHCIDVAIGACETPDGHLLRTVAALVGMDKEAIVKRVKEGALPKLQERIPVEAKEEAEERIAKQTEERNADLRKRGLVGNNTFEVQNFAVTQLSLRSRPEAVFVSGLFHGKDVPYLGADTPKPASLATSEDPGVTADVHLPSLLANGVAAVLQRDDVKAAKNVMISITEAPPGTPPGATTKVKANVDYPTYVKAVDAGRKSTPRVTVLRVARPDQAPEFSTDAKGNLIVIVRDFQIEVPAPEAEARGGIVGAAAKVYRIKIPEAELVASYTVETPAGKALQIHGQILDFTPSPNSEVLAITDDETKAVPLSRFSAVLVLGGLGGRLRSQPINISGDQIKIPGFRIHSVSPLDPSGWVRAILEQTGETAAPSASPSVPSSESAPAVPSVQPESAPAAPAPAPAT